MTLYFMLLVAAGCAFGSTHGSRGAPPQASTTDRLLSAGRKAQPSVCDALSLGCEKTKLAPGGCVFANQTVEYTGGPETCSFNYSITFQNAHIKGRQVEGQCGYDFSDTLAFNNTPYELHLTIGSSIVAPSILLQASYMTVDATSVINASCGAPGVFDSQGYAADGGGGSHLGQGGAQTVEPLHQARLRDSAWTWRAIARREGIDAQLLRMNHSSRVEDATLLEELHQLDSIHGGWPPAAVRSLGSVRPVGGDSPLGGSSEPIIETGANPSMHGTVAPSWSVHQALLARQQADRESTHAAALPLDDSEPLRAPTPTPFVAFGYDSLSYPWEFGGNSQAGNKIDPVFARGGGRIRLVGLSSESQPIPGDIRIDGVVVADGQTPVDVDGQYFLGGGGGGSIFISGGRVTINSPAGIPTLRAVGGSSLYKCGGGGGIITVVASTGLFASDTGVTATSGGVTLDRPQRYACPDGGAGVAVRIAPVPKLDNLQAAAGAAGSKAGWSEPSDVSRELEQLPEL